MEVENLILLSTQVLLRSKEVSLAQPQSQKSTELTTTLMHTIVLIQIIKYSYITVSRKYTYWQNNTQVFLTNPCSLKKMFTLRVTHQLILRKHGFAKKKSCVILSV